MILFGKDVRQKMLKGSNLLSKAVGDTMGARGKNFAFTDYAGNSIVTNDGVTVANSTDIENDPVARMGANLIKEATRKVSAVGGDGTTTATVIASYAIKHGMKAANRYNPIYVKRGMDLALDVLSEYIANNCKGVTSKDEVTQVASISANNDNVIGKVISDSLAEVGKNGLVTVRLGVDNKEDVIEMTDGIEIGAGYVSPNMFTNAKTLMAELVRPLIVLFDGRIDKWSQLNQLAIKASEVDRPLVVIAEKIESQALNTMELNHVKGVMRIVGIEAPGVGENKTDLLKDLSILLDAKLFESKYEFTLEGAMIEELGTCDIMNIGSEYTEIVCDPEIAQHEETQTALKERIDQLTHLIDNTTEENLKHVYRSRLAKLDGKIAVINVGGSSDIDRHERAARMTDSLHAARAAIANGIVEGGGVHLIKASKSLDEYISKSDVAKDVKTGMKIVSDAIKEPFNTILRNAELKPKKYINKIHSNKIGGVDVNLLVEIKDSMFSAGIIDPRKVTETAVSQAISIASTIITISGAYIKDAPEAKKGLLTKLKEFIF